MNHIDVNEKTEKTVKLIERAVEEFNRYRAPEARAEILQVYHNIAIIKFSGSFCMSCGVYDYFEDLLWISDLSVEILGFEEIEDGFAVKYLIRETR